jgi:hypothetical protein
MSVFTDLLGGGGSVVRQLFTWQVVGQVVSAGLGPYFRKLGQLVNAQTPNDVLSPADLAQSVVRGVRTIGTAAGEAAASGIDTARFTELTHLAAGPPGIESILQWYRRGIVKWGEVGPTKPTVANAVATSRVYTYWSDIIRKANVIPIAAAVIVDALVENQTTAGTRGAVTAAAHGGTATPEWAESTSFYEVMWANGYTPDQADLMFRTRGNPPSPGELFTLYRRGEIELSGTGPDALTVQQGIFEGATKDKWWPTLTGLIRQIPSEYYIKLMLTEGAITPDKATELLTQLGYTPTVVSGIVQASIGTQLGTYKKLTESIIVKLYNDLAISRTEAKQLLTDIGYGETAATFVLTTVDLTRTEKALSAAITKIGTRYTAHKLSAQDASASLAALGVPATQAAQLIQTWTVTRATTLKLLTAADITDAWKYDVLSATQALTALVELGYTPFDAWVLLSVKAEGPIGPAPAKTVTTGGTL